MQDTSKKVFDNVIEETHYDLSISCEDHKNDMTIRIVTDYIVMRERGIMLYSPIAKEKISQKRKKLAKLVSV